MNEKKQNYFAFQFLARLTHDYLNSAGLMDPYVRDIFERLFADNLMSNTIMVFFSDHGLRFGDIRETLSGRYENSRAAQGRRLQGDTGRIFRRFFLNPGVIQGDFFQKGLKWFMYRTFDFTR